jgi:hypothetical protein
MAGSTVNYALPYPDGDDDPCDFATQWCSFTDAVNEILDGFQATIDRTVPVIPAAQMRVTVSRAYNTVTERFIQFDAVSFDTAGWTDFDANPRAISTDRAAVFGLHASDITDPDGVNSIWTIEFYEIDTTGATTAAEDQSVLDRGVAGQRVGNEVTDLVVRNLPIDTYVEVRNNSVTTFTLTNGYMSIWWHADEERSA